MYIMNYKTIILLLALFFVILLIYREVYNLNLRIKQNEEQQRKEHTDMVYNVNRCLTQIKSFSLDNMNQLKTIAMINQQLATKRTVNGFTETTGEKMSKYSESESESEPDNKHPHFYMSSQGGDISRDSSIPEQVLEDPNVVQYETRHNVTQPEIIQPFKYNPDEIIRKPEALLLNPFITMTNMANMTNMLSFDIADILFNHTDLEKDSSSSQSEPRIQEVFDEQSQEDIKPNIEEIKDTEEIKETKEIKDTKEIKEIKEDIKPKKTIKIKDITEYNLAELRNLSKKYNLPIHIKQDNRTRLFRKDELYQHLKEFLSSS